MCLPSPKVPKAPSIPRPPTPLSEGVLNARERERQAAQNARGHASTILTGPRGIQDQGTVLGGGQGTTAKTITPTATTSTIGGQTTVLGNDNITALLKQIRGKKKGAGGAAGSGSAGGAAGTLLGGSGVPVSGITGFAR